MLVLTLAASLVAQVAQAAPRKQKPEAQAEGQLSLEEIAVMLSSSKPDEVRMAIEGAATVGTPDVIPLIQERIRAGLPPDLLEVAMDSVLLLGHPSAEDLFATLARHRRASVRKKALQALVTLRSPGANAVLSQGLSDDAAEVREAAAEGLGELGAAASADRLFLAFDHNVMNAGKALGRVVKDDQVPRLLAYFGRVPLTTLTPVLDALLTRRDLSEATKLSVISALTELATAEARGYLEGLSQRLPGDTPVRVRRAIDEAVSRIAK
jgi:HEAT repeat protein